MHQLIFGYLSVQLAKTMNNYMTRSKLSFMGAYAVKISSFVPQRSPNLALTGCCTEFYGPDTESEVAAVPPFGSIRLLPKAGDLVLFPGW